MKIVILAAGKGSRMQSHLPKPLLPVAGKPMLTHVMDTVSLLDDVSDRDLYVVYGHEGETMINAYPDRHMHWVEQSPQLGTGHAVQCAMPPLNGVDLEENVLILYGDVPLLSENTLKNMFFQHILQGNALTLLSTVLEEPTGYGRLIRNEQGSPAGIVEEKDASDEQRLVNEVNTGIMMAKLGHLRNWLSNLDNNNAQAEYYLTDIVAMAVENDKMIGVVQCEDPSEVAGANTPEQLKELENAYYERAPSA